MSEDLRCCGTGTCLINNEGHCWCGQRWDGTKMCFGGSDLQPVASAADTPPKSSPPVADLPD